MSNGIDWFRWHHGTVTDPKFQLISKQCGASVAEVLAVWAFVLEAASMNQERGDVGQLDFESIDCALGLVDGKAECIYTRMQLRNLVDEEGNVVAWGKRQPKREDDKSTDRVRRFRERKHELKLVEAQGHARERSGTQRNAVERTETIEESREEKYISPSAHPVFVTQTGQDDHFEPEPKTASEEGSDIQTQKPVRPKKPEVPPEGFTSFWNTWPATERKADKKKCLAKWKRHDFESKAEEIVRHVETMKDSRKWQDGFEPAPLTYLNGERWNDNDSDAFNGTGIKAMFKGMI